MITEPCYWYIPTIYELKFSSYKKMQAYSPVCFRYRFITKNFFASSKSFWGFRKTGPFRENGTSTLFRHRKIFYYTIVTTKTDWADIFKLVSMQSMIHWLGPSDISRCCQIGHQAKFSAQKAESNCSDANRLQVWSLHPTPVTVIRASCRSSHLPLY